MNKKTQIIDLIDFLTTKSSDNKREWRASKIGDQSDGMKLQLVC